MKWNKKAIMVDFLVTILLAIIIFVPACLLSSKLYQQSDESKSSFYDFVSEVEKFSKDARDGEIKSVLLNVDVDSPVVFFKDKEKVLVDIENVLVPEGEAATTEDFYYYFNFPSEKCSNLPCLCLCQEYSSGEAIQYDPQMIYDVECGKIYCQDFSDLKLEKSWSHFRRSEQSFIKTGISKEADSQRRVVILLTKQNDQLVISEQ